MVVDTTRGVQNHWEERTIRVADFVTPIGAGARALRRRRSHPGSVVEAALDDVIVYDAATAERGRAAGGAGARAALSARRCPNPARGAVSFTLELPRAGGAMVEVLDVTGRRVRTLHSGAGRRPGPLALAWDGAGEGGRAAPAALLRARAGR